MACGVCEHCHSPVFMRDQIAKREGFSYHKKCHKCYVCSETNLHNAEVFKGVIFCSSCAQRIFQGCASVRKTKQQVTNRAKHLRSRSRRKREKIKTQEKRIDREINGVIELAQLAGSTSASCETVTSKKFFIFNSSKETTTAMPIQVEKLVYDFQRKKSLKAISLEMGTTTVVTQNLLNQINEPETKSFNKPISNLAIASSQVCHIPPVRHRKKKKDIVPPRTNKQIVSDLRIAELGVSTEIANMALRKKSELPIIIKSDSRTKQISSDSPSVLNQESAESRDEQPWMNSTYSSLNDEKKSCLDRRLGSIIKLPYKFFKKNILDRSSLISIAMSSSDDNNYRSLLKRMKRLFYEEITEHQGRGITRLYSTINRRKTPYRLGWLHLVANVSKALYEESSSHKETPKKRASSSYKETPKKIASSSYKETPKKQESSSHKEMPKKRASSSYKETPKKRESSSLKETIKKQESSSHKEMPKKLESSSHKETPKKPCKHFKASHSYRCMRAQVMRLAGPTPSQLAVIRKKIKTCVAPRFVRHIARDFYNAQEPKNEQPKTCYLETVFKASPIRKQAVNEKAVAIGHVYADLWPAFV